MDTFQIALIIAGLVFAVGLFGLIKKVRLPLRTTIFTKRTFLIFGALLIVAAILAQFHIFFRGYWTTKILIWLFILAASLLFAFGDRAVLAKPLRILAGVVFYFPLASVLWFFIVPFMGPVLSLTIWGHILGDKDDIFYSDNDLRLQRVFRGALGGLLDHQTIFRKAACLNLTKEHCR